MLCKRLPAALFLAGAFIAAPPAYAGPYGDGMAKCLISSSSEADRKVFVRWLFTAIALNPDVATMTAISDEQRRSINKDVASLLQRLMTVSCRKEVVEAIKFEGPQTVEQAFNLFGQVAGREMFANPRVAEGAGELRKFLDDAEFKKLKAEASDK